jgi:ADP-heptose:LPS heptosyltransferase
MSDEPERILIVRTDRLGDVILTLPLISVLRRAYPRAHLAVLLRRYTGSIVEGHRDVDEILWYDGPEGMVPFGEMLRQLRRGAFDVAIAVYPRFRIAALLFLSGIGIRIGSGFRFYSFLFNRRVYEHRRDAKRHELEYNLNLLKPLGITPPEPGGEAEFGIVIPAASRERAEGLLRRAGIERPFAVLHPGTGKSAREWSRAKIGELGARIGEDLGMPVVVTGMGSEADLVHEVAARAGHAAVELAGELSLMDLAALLQRASVWVGHSTGPLHLAVAVGTPVVGLYPQLTAMSARRWGPYTRRSRVHVPDKPKDCSECEGGTKGICACMESISVESVVQSVAEIRKQAMEV